MLNDNLDFSTWTLFIIFGVSKAEKKIKIIQVLSEHASAIAAHSWLVLHNNSLTLL